MTTKTIRVDDRLDPELAELVSKAEPDIERVLGPALDRVEVVWEPGPGVGDGEPVARIRLSDAGVSRTRDFTTWQLEDEVQLRRGLLQVWDQVLAERLRLQWQRVIDSLADPNGG